MFKFLKDYIFSASILAVSLCKWTFEVLIITLNFSFNNFI